MRRSIRAAFEDEVATLRHLVQAQAEQFEARQLERDAAYEVRLSCARTVDGGVRYTRLYNGGSCGSASPFKFQVLDLQITRTQSSAIASRRAFL